jgi:hypothetical protein
MSGINTHAMDFDISSLLIAEDSKGIRLGACSEIQVLPWIVPHLALLGPSIP